MRTLNSNAYNKAKKLDEYYRYKLEIDIKKYAPVVLNVQTLVAPPKGKYCNSDYKFCPFFLMGGFCSKLGKGLQNIDGQKFTIIKVNGYNVAVGAYRVFKKRCNDQLEQFSMF